jgi:hypothetical protein
MRVQDFAGYRALRRFATGILKERSPLPRPWPFDGGKYRRLKAYATGDKLAVSGEVNLMIAAAINVNPEWFWHGPGA